MLKCSGTSLIEFGGWTRSPLKQFDLPLYIGGGKTMNHFKKVLKGHWQSGKGYKKSSNRRLRRIESRETKALAENSLSTESERLIIKSEIQEEEYIRQEHLYDFDVKKPGPAKIKKKSKKQIQCKIDHIEKKLSRLNGDSSGYMVSLLRGLYEKELKGLNDLLIKANS